MSCPKFTQLFVSARKMKAQALLHGKRSNISQWHFGCFHLHSYRQQQIYCRVCNRICLIPYIWFLMRILDFGKCNPFGTAKAGERFAKELRKGGSWELLFSTTFTCETLFPMRGTTGKIVHLPRKVTLELHQTVHLPRKVTLRYSTLL